MEVMIISGKSGSGKDTFADIMRSKLEKVGCKCLTIHFADLVKYYAEVYYKRKKKKNEAGRKLLQQLGTDKLRAKFPNYWCEHVAQLLAAVPDDFDCAFIPDARFENEISVVKQYNPQAKVIRIERYNEDGSPYLNPMLTPHQHQHQSEVDLDNYEDWDYIIENHSLEELKQSADVILADLKLLA